MCGGDTHRHRKGIFPMSRRNPNMNGVHPARCMPRALGARHMGPAGNKTRDLPRPALVHLDQTATSRPSVLSSGR